MAGFQLIRFDSRLAAYTAYSTGKIESLFYESETVDEAAVRDHARQAGVGGTHGFVA